MKLSILPASGTHSQSSTTVVRPYSLWPRLPHPVCAHLLEVRFVADRAMSGEQGLRGGISGPSTPSGPSLRDAFSKRLNHVVGDYN